MPLHAAWACSARPRAAGPADPDGSRSRPRPPAGAGAAAPGFAALVVEFGARLPSAEAARLLALALGPAVCLAPNTVLAYTLAAGRARQEPEAAALAGRRRLSRGEVRAAFSPGTPPAPGRPAPAVLAVALDGALERTTAGWKEVKLGAVCDLRRPAAPAGPRCRVPVGAGARATTYTATLAPAEAFGGSCTRRPAPPPGLARRVAVLGDGAKWICKLAARRFPGAVQVVDWYHLKNVREGGVGASEFRFVSTDGRTRRDDAGEHPGVRRGGGGAVPAGRYAGEGGDPGRVLPDDRLPPERGRAAPAPRGRGAARWAAAGPAAGVRAGGSRGPAAGVGGQRAAVREAAGAVPPGAGGAAGAPGGGRAAPTGAGPGGGAERGDGRPAPAGAPGASRGPGAPGRARGARPATAALRAQVPVRTAAEWAAVVPGECQADLVLHCGETTRGFHLTTLVIVDVASGWTELEAVWGKGLQRVGAAVHETRRRLPGPLRALHTDNGGEFLNELLVPYCRRVGIRLTRGRPYRKNDQAHVEQKHWSVVRKLVGYGRYESEAALAQLNRVYELLRVWTNVWQPSLKLVAKGRDDTTGKTRKKYDAAQTPYRRLLASGGLDETQRRALAETFAAYGPMALRRQLAAAVEQLGRSQERSNERLEPETDETERKKAG